jgi:peptidoglycan/xylan/chitin deacetylase (PgdA/CDA1 family)
MSHMDERAERRALERRARRRRGRIRLAALVLVVVAGATAAVVLASGGTKPRAPAVREAARPGQAAPVRPLRAQRPPARLTLPSPLPSTTLTLPILMYHRIDYLRPTLPAITRSLTVDPADFAAQMQWLRGHGYRSITQLQLFDALERGGSLPQKPVLITFDDGYRDVFGKAMPILARLHMHATAYVITSRISGPDPSFLTWGQLASLERHGFDIGSHTVHHVELPSVPAATATTELLDSRIALERRLGHPVQWFAYPAGRFDSATVALVRRAGYVLAVTTQPGSRQQANAPLELHRYEILDTTGVSGLRALLGA